jgi:hypothetical protein
VSTVVRIRWVLGVLFRPKSEIFTSSSHRHVHGAVLNVLGGGGGLGSARRLCLGLGKQIYRIVGI